MAVIEFNDVSKCYRLGASRTSLREAIMHMPAQLMRRTTGQQPDDQLFWALRNVSFDVKQGEVLGIIGHNGAGKSTILKLLSRVAFPTTGTIHTAGRMASLIELGAGFHPDLSGRENIYLNGSIMGLTRHEIDTQFDSIVNFSSLEKFIDTPVKRYSSGMYVRLAFAVAAHVQAELLIVDEVLSVGDTAFQQKCLNKMNQLRDDGATIVFVSHNIWSVVTFCKRVLLLGNGQIQVEGKPEDVAEAYRRQQRENLLKQQTADETNRFDEHVTGAAIMEIEVLDRDGAKVESIDYRQPVQVRFQYVAHQRIETPVFVVYMSRADGLQCFVVGEESDPIEGVGTVEVWIDPLQLAADIYSVGVQIIDSRNPIVYSSVDSDPFYVTGSMGNADGIEGVFVPHTEWNFPVRDEG